MRAGCAFQNFDSELLKFVMSEQPRPLTYQNSVYTIFSAWSLDEMYALWHQLSEPSLEMFLKLKHLNQTSCQFMVIMSRDFFLHISVRYISIFKFFGLQQSKKYIYMHAMSEAGVNT